MAVKGNSFENRDKRNKKKSSIVKMSELREENKIEIKAAAEEITKESSSNVNAEHKMESIEVKAANNTVEVKENIISAVDQSAEEVVSIEEEPKVEVISQAVEETLKPQKADDFFNLNVKNCSFGGKLTTVRVFDDILETLKSYASMKNYQIIEFTNKVIAAGLENLDDYGITQITEIKLKNNTSKAIMYNLTDSMEDKINRYIKEMNKKGYKISRNVILNVLLSETLKKFYV